MTAKVVELTALNDVFLGSLGKLVFFASNAAYSAKNKGFLCTLWASELEDISK